MEGGVRVYMKLKGSGCVCLVAKKYYDRITCIRYTTSNLSTVFVSGKGRGHYTSEKVEHSILMPGIYSHHHQIHYIYLYSLQCIAVLYLCHLTL